MSEYGAEVPNCPQPPKRGRPFKTKPPGAKAGGKPRKRIRVRAVRARSSGGARGGSFKSGRPWFLKWALAAIRKAVMGRSRRAGGSDFRNHGATGVKGKSFRTGRAGGAPGSGKRLW